MWPETLIGDRSFGSCPSLSALLNKLSPLRSKTMAEYSVRWQEFNRRDEAVTKEKHFTTEKARDKFCDKVQDKDNFWRFCAWSDG
jgi:hypothetical protein